MCETVDDRIQRLALSCVKNLYPQEMRDTGSPVSINSNRSPAPHFRPIRPPGIANYSQETSLNEPGALDERLRTLVTQSFEGGGERL
ncbi:MAG: hypothetical protein GY702_03455, partial [Desulfobulbaceae bacterium]|nr:hypothetical protein [Desulfobulbaceae bacterium]